MTPDAMSPRRLLFLATVTLALLFHDPAAAAQPMVAAGYYHTVGLKADGSVIAVGYDRYGQTDVGTWSDVVQVAAGSEHTVGVTSDGSVVATGYNNAGQTLVGAWTGVEEVAAGGYHTVGRRSGGTVVAVGDATHGQTSVGAWTDIVQVTAGLYHTAGVRSDGTVVATGQDTYGQTAVGSWTGVEEVAAGGYHTVGRRSDGTVTATGYDLDGQLDVGDWSGVLQVAAGLYHTVGLRSDGTVVATGHNGYGQTEVGAWADIVQVAAGRFHTVGLKSDGTVVATGQNTYGQTALASWIDVSHASAGGYHSLGLKSDGTVLATGVNVNNQIDVGDWTGILQVSAGYRHSVGVKPDGTVAAVGYSAEGQLAVGDWTGIVEVSAGAYHTVGRVSDGTVVAAGPGGYTMLDVGSWAGIVQVGAGSYHTVGRVSDGTVVAVGQNASGQTDVGAWTGIVQVAVGGYHTVGLKSDGTVVAVGQNASGQTEVDGWTDIVQVAAGQSHTVGLKSDGTVVAAGLSDDGRLDVDGWSDIVEVSAGFEHTVGVQSDGTVVAVGNNYYGPVSLYDWNLTSGAAPPDTDGDGIPDSVETGSCTSETEADSDGDGLEDGVEDADRDGARDPGETDPCDPDTDDDGLADGVERDYWGAAWSEDGDGDGLNSVLDPDADGDGTPDGDEISRGADPGDALSLPPDLDLYDDFSADLVDGQLWRPRSLVDDVARETQTMRAAAFQKLHQRIVAGGYTRLRATVDGAAVDVDDIAGFRSLVRVFRVEREPGSGTGAVFARLDGYYYQSQTAPVWAAVGLVETGAGLKCRWYVTKQGSGTQSGGLAAAATFAMDTDYLLEVRYDGGTDFFFQVSRSDGTVIDNLEVDAADYGYTRSGATALAGRALAVGMEDGAAGEIYAAFDDVARCEADCGEAPAWTPYDDFSSGEVSADRWADLSSPPVDFLETGAVIAADHRLKTTTGALDGEEKTEFMTIPAGIAYLQAAVSVDSASRYPGGEGGVGLGGFVYNDTCGGGSCPPENGHRGDVWATVYLEYDTDSGAFQAACEAERTDDASGTETTEIAEYPFTVEIAPDTVYTLSMGWAGSHLVFGVRAPGGEVEYRMIPLPATIHPPSRQLLGLGSGAESAGGTAVTAARFDDVYVIQDGGLAGDLSADGTVDLTDAVLALQVLAGAPAPGVDGSAALNPSGAIGIREVIYILQQAGSLR